MGSHLTDLLLARGETVVVVDNLLTGRMDNIARHLDNGCFSFIQQDVSHYIDVPGEVDAVMHLASPASPAPGGRSNMPASGR